MSIIRDPFIYESYEKIILVHGTRWRSELAYQHEIENVLPDNPYFGAEVREKLIYYPTVTREDYVRNGVPHQGRITDLLDSGKLLADIGMPALNPEHDRFMLCGNDAMLQQLMGMLDQRGFAKANSRTMGHYVIEQAFIEK